MKKVVRITESELAEIVKKVLKESEVDEGILSNIINKFRGKKPAVKPSFSHYEIPASARLSPKVQELIKKMPQVVKMGPKLEGLFNRHRVDLNHFQNDIRDLARKHKTLGMAESSSNLMFHIIRNAKKGQNIEVRKLYELANDVKKEMEYAKRQMPVPKEGGILNKNKNYKTQMNDWYNFLYPEIGTLSRFISDFETLIKK